jgi:hypothetical protein
MLFSTEASTTRANGSASAKYPWWSVWRRPRVDAGIWKGFHILFGYFGLDKHPCSSHFDIHQSTRVLIHDLLGYEASVETMVDTVMIDPQIGEVRWMTCEESVRNPYRIWSGDWQYWHGLTSDWIKQYIYNDIIEGKLEVKLPTIWTDGKQRCEESEKRSEEERRSEKRRRQKKEDARARKR